MAQLEKFIKVTQEQYNTLQAGGTVGSHTGINPNFIYLVENNGSSEGGTVDETYVADALSNFLADEIEPKLEDKQDTLVSGTNIKTINGTSILGSGDLTIEGGGGTNVEANPNVEENVEVLTSVSIDNTNYTIPVGIDVTLENEDTLVVTEGTTGISQVMANPIDTPTAVLHTVTINNTVYEIPNVEHVSVGANEIVAGDEVGSLIGSGLTVDQIATKEYVDSKISVVLNEDATVNIIIN